MYVGRQEYPCTDRMFIPSVAYSRVIIESRELSAIKKKTPTRAELLRQDATLNMHRIRVGAKRTPVLAM